MTFTPPTPRPGPTSPPSNPNDQVANSSEKNEALLGEMPHLVDYSAIITEQELFTMYNKEGG